MLAIALTACNMNNEDSGTLAGAAIGGLIGSQFGSGTGTALAVAGGAILGGFIGNRVGKSMDKTDRAKMSRTLETAPTDETVEWKNPDSGNTYAITPTKTYRKQSDSGSSQPCREFISEAVVAGEKQKVYGTACRQADGSWKIA